MKYKIVCIVQKKGHHRILFCTELKGNSTLQYLRKSLQKERNYQEEKLPNKILGYKSWKYFDYWV